MRTPSRNRLTAGLGAAAAIAALAAAAPGATAAHGATPAAKAAHGTTPAAPGSPAPDRATAKGPAPVATYTNPVTAGTVDTFPDPSMIRGKDGAWYAYGTTNPIFVSRGETGEHILPMLRSTDMTHWTYAGDALTASDHPSWWPERTRAWAPDIRYLDGTYHLTYALSGGGVGLLTSSRPTGPWTDRGELVPASGSGCPTGNIDQAMFTDTDGSNYLYWGSYDTICVSRMNADGTALTGSVTQLAKGRRAEGGFVVHRDGHYYLFYSDAGCCDGEFSGYTVKVGRADSPLGPFTTQDGQPLTDLRSHGGIVVTANGNGWIGPGHNAIQTDLSGQDWLVYHAIPEATPNFPPVNGATGGVLPALARRPMLIDRLDWIDGWPVVRAGAGPSEGTVPAPVTTAPVRSDFADGSLSGWQPAGARWSVATDDDAGRVAFQPGSPRTPSTLLARQQVGGDLRIQADLRLTGGNGGAVGLALAARGGDHGYAWLDRSAGQLVVATSVHGRQASASAPLPEDFDWTSWHTVAAEVAGSTVTVEVSADDLHDAVARVRATIPTGASGRVGVVSVGAPAQAANISAAPLARPVIARVPDPVLGAELPAYSDDFGGTGRPETADPSWSWVRRDRAQAVEGDGVLAWPTQSGDLYDTDNTASVLLREAPQGDFAVETKLTFDGTRGNQQAGLVLYENDDRYVKLTHSVLPLAHGDGAVLHVTEFGKEAERPTTVPPTAVFNGPMFGGPPATTTWLRLVYHHDSARDENEVRMASSTDGSAWSWGGTWTMPTRGPLRIGLVSMNTPGATARFDYVHTYRLAPAS